MTALNFGDLSVPRESAERLLRVKPGALGLNELARRLSLEQYPEDPVSVREPESRPVRHGYAYLRGEKCPEVPYLVRTLPRDTLLVAD